ncbi:hypothetical protein UFOVP728_33 [uncultured Caudovirales phage]|uniref:Uncharacterized protein n=1 Tax=uncultured Caudovirales phage TaxID=2100421 RepID=A0A6J5P0Z0_9CAUD|nr:hypothetical protein UFOVP728_33 [uncultured Caudovirales phage]
MAILIARDSIKHLEVWQTWDDGAKVYELWTGPECQEHIGCADTPAERRRVVVEWLAAHPIPGELDE